MLENKKVVCHDMNLIKVIAIFFVLCIHCLLLPYDFLESPGFYTYLNYTLYALFPIAVPLFFMVNGYFLFNKSFDAQKHKKKTINLFFLTVIWGVITIFYVGFMQHKSYGISELFQQLILFFNEGIAGGPGHLWFLWVLLVLYLVFPILKYLFDNNHKLFVYSFLFIFSLTFGSNFLNMAADFIKCFFAGGMMLLREYRILGTFNPFSIYAYTLVYFMLGGIIGKNIGKIKEKSNPWILAAAVFLSTFLYSIWGVFQSRTMNKIVMLPYRNDEIFVLINAICIFLLCTYFTFPKENRISKLIDLMGENTLGVYLVHLLLLPFLMMSPLVTLVGTNQGLSVVYYILTITIWLIGCLCVVLLLKKIPIIKKLFKI